MDKYKYFFGCLQTIGGYTMNRLLGRFGTEFDLYHASDQCIESASLLTANQLKELLERRRTWNIDKEWDRVIAEDIVIVSVTDSDYPERLRNINGLPYMLFYKGKLPDEDKPSIAIIGARMCSEYGKSMARYFAEGLAEQGVQIISGLASGIDGLSQRAAINAGGESYGVLGTGIDVCYPTNNRDLYNELQDHGGIISEFPLGTRPLAMNFPKRNRIISGLADLVLVIEAKPRSGTSITVSMALDQGRQVFAVPGRVGDALSQGCNTMIADGAGIACDVDSILSELGRINFVINEGLCFDKNRIEPLFENELEKEVYGDIKNNCNTVETIISNKPHISIEKLQTTLMSMELRGIIKNNLGLYSV